MRYFFHLAGDTPAHDVIGLELPGLEEARLHGEFLSRHFSADKPEIVRNGNHISVRDERDVELVQIALAEPNYG